MRKIRIWIPLVLLVVGLMPVHASKRILVDLTHQVAIAYQDGKVLFFGRISSGKPGRETPTGSYYVREKDVDHVSNLWPQPNGGARMPYMLRITRDGVAMHLGNTPDYPASHGCVRMQDGFAQRMYNWAEKWTKVDIVGKAPAHSPAVALPAYARSSKILRRSLGGVDGNPLSIFSANPKVNGTPRERLVLNTEETKTPVRPSTKPRHTRPLDIFSANPKRHASAIHTARKRSQKKRIRKPHKRRNPHPNPLHAVSSH